MAATDPVLWTPSEVAQYFRNEAADTAKKFRPSVRLPDLDAFASKLEEHDVDGAVLFEDVDKEFLKDDCNINKLAQRSAILLCISQLKARSQQFRAQAVASTPHTPSPSLAQTPEVPGISTPSHTHTPPESTSGERVRKGEQQVEDERGRKRRRLDLSSSAPVQAPALPDGPAPSPGFLDDASRPIDALFFGKTLLGGKVGELPPERDVVNNEDCQDPDLAMFNFQFQAQNKPFGEAEYVYARMRHFMQIGLNEIIPKERDSQRPELRRVIRHGRPAVAVLPYQRFLSTEKVCQSALVFQTPIEGSEPVMIRENAAYLDTDINYNLLPQEPTNGSYDYLIAKYKQTDDDVLPAYDAEEAVSVSESLEDELQQEQEDEHQQALKGERLAEVINNGIAQLTQKIQERKLPIWSKRAWTEWKKTKQSRSIRAELVAGATAIIRQLEARIDKIRDAMLTEEWASEKQILDDCERLDATLEDIEKQRWKIDIWNSPQEPAHEVRHQHHSSAPPSTKQSGHIGIQLHPNDRFTVEPAMPSDPVDDFPSARGSPAAAGEDGIVAQDEDEDASDEMSPHGLSEDEAMDDFVAPDSPIQAVEPSEHSHYYEDSGPQTPSPNDNEQGSNSDSDRPEDALGNFINNLKPEKKTPAKQTASASRTLPMSPIEISSDSTPAKSGKKKRTPGKKVVYSSQPLEDTVTAVESWDLQELTRNQDRIRIIMKLLLLAGKDVRSALADKIRTLRMPNFSSSVSEMLARMRKNWDCSGDPSLMFAAKLFLSWTLNRPSIVTDAVAPDLAWSLIKTDPLSVMTCFNQVQPLLVRKNLWEQRNKNTASSTLSKSTQVIDLSSDEANLPGDSSKPNKRKKPILTVAAKKSQVAALQRQDRSKLTESQASNSQELQAMIQADPSRSTVPINLASKADDQELIFIQKNIAQQLKEHQIAGIRFMWRELTAQDDGAGQGCILAHTMGLGKTVQTIAVLVAINEAAQSRDPAIFEQIPDHLRPDDIQDRQLRMLVLCPPQLIQNWRREIAHWASKQLRNVFSVEQGMPEGKYLDQMKSWHLVGGILLIGYDLFRNKLHGRTNKNGKLTHIGQKLDEYLLNAPEVVVADEAHILKNEKSAISVAANTIQTHCRIGLTGTPMSNDVDEIYSLISFAAPGYLGEKAWFNSRFSKPIKEGNSYDSTYDQKKRGNMKLKVLHGKIEPKIDRKDITWLRGSLKPKIEFVIKMPLTARQREIYQKYLAVVLGDAGRADETSQVKIFSWLAVLTLLTNHPLSFKKKLLEPPKPAKAKTNGKDAPREPTPGASDSGSATPAATVIGNDEDAIDDLDTTLRALGLPQEAIHDLIADVPDTVSPELSAKMIMLFDILRMSKECGDKVLVFSSKLLTLDYVEQALGEKGIRCGRIDGRVPSSKREQLVKDFWADKTEVMIISTRAGGVGLNIQCANRVVILDFGFNPSHEEQAIGRAYRLGQQKPVFVYRMAIGGTFEDEIYNKQMFKTSLTQRVVDKKNPRRNATGKAGEWLYEPQELIQQDLNQYVGMDKILDNMLTRQLSTPEEDYDGPLIRHLTTIETLQEDANDEPLNAEEQAQVDKEILDDMRTAPRYMRRANGLTSSQIAMPPPRLDIPSTAPVKSRVMTNNGLGPRAAKINPKAQGQGLSRMISLPVPSTPHGLPLPSQMGSMNGTAGPSSTAPAGRSKARP